MAGSVRRNFFFTLTPALVARDLMTAGCGCEDISSHLGEVMMKRQIQSATNKPPEVKVKYMALAFAPIDYDTEPILEKYAWRFGTGDKHDPGKPYEEEYPEFLVRFGAPSSLAVFEATKDKKKRKAGHIPSNESIKKAKTTRKTPLAAACNLGNGSRLSTEIADQTPPAPKFRMPRTLSSLLSGDENVI